MTDPKHEGQRAISSDTQAFQDYLIGVVIN